MSRSAVVEQSPPRIEQRAQPPLGPTEQSGSPLFAELVWAHHVYERERSRGRASADELQRLEQAYHDRLEEFQGAVGRLAHAYWSTKEASAVAMTVEEDGPGRPRWVRRLAPNLLEHDQRIQLHRLTDWATKDTPHVADLLQECDLLAIRVAEVLRGTSERIAMRSLLGVQAHLLGFVERASPTVDEKAFAKAQREELAAVESYYHRAASRAGRLVYVSGMLMGLIPVLVIAIVVGFILAATGLWDRQAELTLLSAGAGALGAFVSAISRMGKPEKGKFNVDFELGRPLIRRLGLFRPFLGAIAGVALCFLVASGVAQVELTGDQEVAYYGFAAFLAGFSERFATVMFGTAERRLSKE